ncbi:Replication factor-A carboxy-terminal domain protein [Arachis hypogaea]|nr:Replication factor-A carboxy-terminal domain protein [Arachis hypogaea]
MWKVPSYEKSYFQPSMELVVLDKEGSRIHCFTQSVHYRLFKPILDEGKVFVKYRPTKHSMRIIFKRETLVSSADDMDILIESFDFVAIKEILSSIRDDLFLIDFFGLLSAKSDLIPFEKKKRKSHYMKIELDDLSEKLSCTLWENYASELVTLLDANKATEFIIMLQFAKMKFYDGVMTITYTNYTTRLMVNGDLDVVKKFCQNLIRLGSKHNTSVDVIGQVVRHSPSEYFLRLTPYAPIHQIKQTLEKSAYVTCGTVIDIDRNHAWWYKAFRQCTQGLEALTNQFYCVRVVDDSDTETFVLFENSASKFLGLSAADIRTSLLARGYGRDHFPEELNALIGKTLLFKLTVRHDSLNKFQACVITVSRICSDPEIIASLALEKNIKLDALQKLPTATGVRSGELIGTGSIVRVAVCIRSDDDLSSRAPLSASKSLLPAFKRCILGNATDPDVGDM